MLELPSEILEASPRGVWTRGWLPLIIDLLAAAESMGDEIHALVAPLGARDQWFVLGTWCYFHQTAPTQQEMIDALPAPSRVSRQRVAQIVQRQNAWLSRSELKPRLLNEAVDVLRAKGGTLSLRGWMKALERKGVPATNAAIRTLPSLSRLGLVGPVSYNPSSRLWSARVEHDDRNADDTAWASDVRRIGRAALRLQGAIPRADLAGLARYGIEHALELIDDLARGWAEVDGFLVPKPQGRSRLTHLARKILSISAPLHVGWISRGISRTTQQPIRLPISVVRAVLARHPDFQVRAQRVRPRNRLDPRNVLTDLEFAFVETIINRGGTITAGAVTEWLRNRDVTVGFTGHLCRAPFVRRLSRGVYALAGRARPYVRGTADVAQRPFIGTPRWEGESTCLVTYRMEAVKASGGLWLPGDLAFALALTPGRWEAILPDDTNAPMQFVNRQLVGLRDWISSVGTPPDAILIAEFDLHHMQVALSISRP